MTVSLNQKFVVKWILFWNCSDVEYISCKL